MLVLQHGGFVALGDRYIRSWIDSYCPYNKGGGLGTLNLKSYMRGIFSSREDDHSMVSPKFEAPHTPTNLCLSPIQ
jgi:hypothetical protein